MDLFQPTDKNLLPYDGEVIYHGILLDPNESEQFFNALLQKIDWYNDKSIVFGKEVITKRKVAWYGSKDFSYTYSGVTRIRSEEHTSELQSRENLVCRLLLE